MKNVNELITSLKVTWLRRLMIFSDNDNWSSLSSINLNKMFSLGDTYSKTVIKDLRNHFWKGILESWVKYLRSYKIDSLVKVMYSPLWDNSLIHENKNHIINEWYIKGIRNVMDLIDEDGSMYDFQTLKDVYEIHGTYLDYFHLINKIPRLWRDLVNDNSIKNASYKYNVQINCYVFNLLRKRRGCRDIYDKIVPVDEIIVPKNLINENGEISEDE